MWGQREKIQNGQKGNKKFEDEGGAEVQQPTSSQHHFFTGKRKVKVFKHFRKIKIEFLFLSMPSWTCSIVLKKHITNKVVIDF